MLNGKNILITGGTGSFGKKCTEVILKQYKPKRLDHLQPRRTQAVRDEPAVSGSTTSLHPLFFIGDVRDRDRLHRAHSRGVDFVIHAAALKQVPAAEYNPFEAIKTNIIGAENVIDAAIDRDVKRVIALSTDKAVESRSTSTARRSSARDKLFVAANAYAGRPSRRGSRSSATATSSAAAGASSRSSWSAARRRASSRSPTARMTRFWITLDQGVRLRLDLLERMHGGGALRPQDPEHAHRRPGRGDRAGVQRSRSSASARARSSTRSWSRSDEARDDPRIGGYYLIQPNFRYFARRFSEDRRTPVPGRLRVQFRYQLRWLTVEELRRWSSTLNELIPYGRQCVDEERHQAPSCAVLRSDWLTTGPKVAEFEEAFAGRGDASTPWRSVAAPRRCMRPCTPSASTPETRSSCRP